MNFLNIKKFAEFKQCTRQTVYNAETKGEINIDRSSGIPLVHLTEKNLKWKPGKNIGRPQKKPANL